MRSPLDTTSQVTVQFICFLLRSQELCCLQMQDTISFTSELDVTKKRKREKKKIISNALV